MGEEVIGVDKKYACHSSKMRARVGGFYVAFLLFVVSLILLPTTQAQPIYTNSHNDDNE